MISTDPERYGLPATFDIKEHLERFINPQVEKLLSFGITASDTALDLGSCFGWHSHELARRGVKKIVGVDLNLKVVNNTDSHVSFISANWHHLPFQDQVFDAAFLLSGIVFCKSLSDIVRVIRPGGLFIFDIEIFEELLAKHRQIGGNWVWERIIELNNETNGDLHKVKSTSLLDPSSYTVERTLTVWKNKEKIQNEVFIKKVLPYRHFEQRLAKMGLKIKQIDTVHDETETNLLTPNTYIVSIKQ